MQKTWLLSLFIVFASQLTAQQELMLHSLPNIWHSTTTNPAFFPENKKFVLGLSGVGLDAAHSGDITYRDIFKKNGDRTIIDFSNAIDRLDPNNEAQIDQRSDVVSLGFRLPGKMYLQAGYANRLSGVVNYPKSLPELLWYGNGQYIGETLEIAPQADIADWNEWSIGFMKEFGKVRLGVRGKILSGVSALRSDPDHASMSVYTSPDIYQLTLHTDYGFYSSSIISSIDTAGLGFDFKLAETKRKYLSTNTGNAVDIGIQVKVNDKLTLDASVLDIGGKITWDSKSNYFLSQGDYEYEGTVFPGTDIINGADSLSFNLTLDTLNDVFNFEKTPTEFTSKLPLRGYFGAQYTFSKRLEFGVNGYFSKPENSDANYAVGLSARWHLKQWFSVGTMYSVNDRSAANVGFHVLLKLLPLQMYFATDNLFNAFSIKKSPAVNLRAGVALML